MLFVMSSFEETALDALELVAQYSLLPWADGSPVGSLVGECVCGGGWGGGGAQSLETISRVL
jgi:hypothetical protein